MPAEVHKRLYAPPHLVKRADFLRVQGSGRRFRATHVLLFVDPHDDETSRVGFTVSRRVGNAVCRNRVRRRLREVVRLHQDCLVAAVDYVVIAQPNAALADFATLEAELTRLLVAARAFVDNIRPS